MHTPEPGSTIIKVDVPAYRSKNTEVQYPSGIPKVLEGTYSADNMSKSDWAFDNKTLTFYRSSNLAGCFIQIDAT